MPPSLSLYVGVGYTTNMEPKMSQVLAKVQPIRFINAEPGILPFAEGPVPVVLMSFGGEEGPIEDRAVGIIEARQMVVDLLNSLATMGDPLAEAIGNQFFFGPGEPEGELEDEFDTGSNYDDGYGSCGGGSCGG